MDCQDRLDATDLLRLSVREPSLFQIELILSCPVYLLIRVNLLQNWQNIIAFRRQYREISILLLTLDQEKSGFRDRIWEINGVNYEVLSVECLIRSSSLILDLERNYLNPSECHARKGSFDVMALDNDEARKAIFYPIEQILLKDRHALQVFIADTYNSKTVYITFSQKLDAWIVCVGNTARVLKDLNQAIETDEGNCVQEIFNDVMRILRGVCNLEALKLEIDGCTMVGEYCKASPEGLRLKMNEIASNLSQSPAFHPKFSERFFRKYGLVYGNIELLAEFSNVSQFYEHLSEVYTRESSESYNDGVKGRVLYFIEISDNKKGESINEVEDDAYDDINSAKSAKTVVVEVAKILRTEYQALKQIKQLIKGLSASNYEESLLDSQIRKVCSQYNLSQSPERYIGLAHELLRKYLHKKIAEDQSKKELLEIIAENKSVSVAETIPADAIPIIALVSYNFKNLQDISRLLGYKLAKLKRSTVLEAKCIYESDDIDEKFYSNSNILVLALGWNECNEQAFINEVKTLEKKQLPCNLIGYCKKNTEEVIPRIEETFRKIRKTVSSLKEMLPTKMIIINDQETLKIVNILALIITESPRFQPAFTNNPKVTEMAITPAEFIEEVSTGKKICYLVLPLGIPGMGKTFLEPTIKKLAQRKGYDYFSISSDEIRENSMNIYKKQHLGADFDQAFKKTSKSSKNAYIQRLFDIIESCKKHSIIFCDKNHPIDAIISFMKSIAKNSFKSVTIKLIGLAPKCNAKTVTKKNTYDMSLDFIISCMHRVLARDSHQTLVGSPSKKLGVMFAFLSLYKNINFESYLDLGIDYLIKIPFTPESGEFGGSELRELIMGQLQNLRADIEGKHTSLEHISDRICELRCIHNFSNERFLEAELNSILPDLNKLKLSPDALQFVPASVLAEKTSEIPEERKQIIHPKKKEKVNKRKDQRIPVYLGIDLKDSLLDTAVAIILSCLSEIYSFYPIPALQKDINEIAKLSGPGKNRSNSCWKFPNSLHVTSLFIGGDSSKAESKEYLSFNEGKACEIELSHLVYCPGAIICSAVSVKGAFSPLVENKIPHVTLLVANKPPKYSNTILSKVNFSEDMSEASFMDGKMRQMIYCCKFSGSMSFQGINTYFY